MFSSSSKHGNCDAITTILGEGTVLTGDMRFEGTTRIDGQFDGNLSGDNLIVSATGRVLGDIIATSCVCYGQIDGNLTLEHLYVKQGGRINGTITTANMEVESGAVLCGEIKQQKQEVCLLQDTSGE